MRWDFEFFVKLLQIIGLITMIIMLVTEIKMQTIIIDTLSPEIGKLQLSLTV